MILNNSERDKITALINQVLPRTEDRPEIAEELRTILGKMEIEDEYSLRLRISKEDMTYASDVIKRMEVILEKYVNKTDVNDIAALEEAKKELSVQLMYLSSYKDKFLYEIDFMEDIFKKEIFSKLANEISVSESISFTQAEKKVNADERYIDLRREVTEAKIFMGHVKTKYDFFSKMIQVIVQSISVAGKEQYSNRVTN